MAGAEKRIALYGGTFDPIHFGHLNLAVEMQEQHRIDEIFFCPAFLSPHKLDQPPISPRHRKKMVELAIADFPKFRCLDIEIDRQGPSYTIDTIHYIRFRYPNCKYFLILGSDALSTFHKWHRVEELIEQVDLLVGMRTREIPPIPVEAPRKVRESLAAGLTHMKLMEMSATDLRDRLKEGQPCAHLIPKKVLDYISANHLYS
jgi:nicotinate-nucleotide adenylyltransferase